ncbi:MAG TPA: CocE/NonD family hydrolase, partial [Fimbriimonadaceae bacterium]|nr:CocE/NonD family hydrolase [Fimbriimonadaceae bacterium]
MRTPRFVIVLLLPLLATWGQAQERTVFSLGGKEAGANVFDLKPDGKFSSTTNLEIMGMKIESALTGTLEEGVLKSFELKQKVAQTEMSLKLEGTTITATAGGKEQKVPFKPTDRLFANYHPQLLRGLFKSLDKSQPGEKKTNIFVMDSGATPEVSILPRPNRVVKNQGKTTSVPVYLVRLGMVDIEYVVGPENQVLGMAVPSQGFSAVLEPWEDVFVDPTTRFPELSQPIHKVKIDKGVRAAMRDKVHLVADVYAPQGEGKCPVILGRTPYGRSALSSQGEWYARRGYIFVAQDVRGRHDSEGDWDPFVAERKDGYDTIDWVSKQPWCDGNVGMIGASYGGLVQWAAAVEKHPALKCIVPQVSPPDAFFNIPYDHGVPMLMPNLWWANLVKEKETRMELAGRPLPHAGKLGTLPLSKVDDEVLGQNVPFYDAWLERETPNQFRGFDHLNAISGVKIPALHISGWWDGDGIGTKLNYAAARKSGNDKQWLIYGPWSHAFNSSTRLGVVDFGADAMLELDSLYLRWFDTWLKRKEVGLSKVPKVQAFVMGANEWRELRDWPDAASKAMSLFLAPPAAGSEGRLLSKPIPNAKPSRYTYDPSKITVPEAALQAMGQNVSTKVAVKDFGQALLFQSEPLEKDIDLAGPISVDLHFSTTAKDTDFFAILVEIDSKGEARMLGGTGKIRAKYLAGWNTPKLLTPGKPYKATLDLWDTANRFDKGHRIGL